jgi:hypothetical protein
VTSPDIETGQLLWCLRRAAPVGSLLVLLWTAAPAGGQQLDPGAYTPAPVGLNLLVLSNTIMGGDLSFDPTAPIEDGQATINTAAIGYVRSLGILGRAANVAVALPYTLGHVEGLYLKQFQKVHRSGLSDAQVRVSVNLVGAPALTPQRFATFQRRTIVGFSLTTLVPLGQYSAGKLINIGTNRWSFKPEVGLSETFGNWRMEFFAGVWLFTDNHEFLGARTRSQAPILSTQFHFTRTFRRGLWASFNANFYTGGRTSVDDVENFDLQRNSRVGATVALPLGRAQSLKIAYSRGAYTTIGADFDALGVSYQYAWLSRR